MLECVSESRRAEKGPEDSDGNGRLMLKVRDCSVTEYHQEPFSIVSSEQGWSERGKVGHSLCKCFDC
jgi:hypothetical protein